ncbi:oxidoreductase [Vibrio tasmaniensis ZS-17]|uniref:Gfo/Idh/MocA family protein n=1 Tax=Vibrio tasmaniensis TaxID=212663 RepID=UPI0002DF8C26|nr:Gfo/Idh/MocA family oxidoreductase [Vibrio tasmaniensis]OED66452.1 oxidoreductase [Vibrio tasmaniensis ZS-17]
MSENTTLVKWGIAGLGNIAKRFATALTQHSAHGELYAVASRDSERANAFGQNFGCELIYGSYEEMANNPDVDAVYIATVHPYHKPLAELFLSHNKHVLVEKPAFTNLADWLAMKALADKHGVLLLEAMKTMAFPAYHELKSYLSENNIQVTSIEAGFGNEHDYDPNLFIFNPELSGGATLDVGVYGLWFYYDLCRSLSVTPSEPKVEMSSLYKKSNVDTDSLFTFSQGIEGKISASIVSNLPRFSTLRGPELTITIRDKWWNPETIDIEYQGTKHTIQHKVAGNGFEFEIDHMSQLIRDNKTDSDVLLSDVSLQVIETMERALMNAGFGHLTKIKTSER